MYTNILYSFRRCPYAMRARWALLKTNERVVLREVSLNNKPRELLSISPKSTVPVLVTCCGTVIDQSIDIILWTLMKNQAYHFLYDSDDFKLTSESSTIIRQNDIKFKYHLDRYKYPNRYRDINPEHHRNAARAILIDWNGRLSKDPNSWLLGQSETFVDWSVWPFVRQYRMVNEEYFDNDIQIASLRNWLVRYTNNNLFKILMRKIVPWSQSQNNVYFP